MADDTFTTLYLNDPHPEINTPDNLIPSSDPTQSVAAISGQNFHYKVSALNGGETVPSTGVVQTGSGVAISIAFDEVSGATDYRLYRSGIGYSGFLLVQQGQHSPLVDNASISGGLAPTVNTTSYKSRPMGTQDSTYYTSPDSIRTLVKDVIVSNSHDATIQFHINAVPNGETGNLGNSIFYSVSLAAKETKLLEMNAVLNANDYLTARSTALGEHPGFGDISIKINGVQITDA